MKPSNTLVVAIFCILFCLSVQNVLSQDHDRYENDIVNLNSNVTSFCAGCNISNPRFQPSQNIPSQNSPVKLIKIDFNVLWDGSSGGNFQDNFDPNYGKGRLLQIRDWLNSYYNSNGTNNIPPAGLSVSDLPHEYVQFELGDIYFYNDPSIWKTSSASSALSVINSDPSRDPDVINHRLQIIYSEGWYLARIGSMSITNGGSGYTSPPTVTFSPSSGTTAVAQISGGVVVGITLIFNPQVFSSSNNPPNYNFPTITISGGGGSGATAIVTGLSGAAAYAPRPTCGSSGTGYVIMFGAYNGSHPTPTIVDYAGSTTLAHELGHNFDLIHTYNGGGTSANCTSNSSDPMYMNDIYGLVAPGNCPHNVGWSCANLSVSNKIDNNMMGGNQCASYTSPLQIGIIHRSLLFQSVRKYLKECYYDNLNPLTISSPEVWDFDVQWDRDIIVDNGAILDLTCRLSMPQTSTITVKNGSVLNIDGIVTNNCDNGWNGTIHVEPGGILNLGSDAEITLIGNGSIKIDDDPVTPAKLIYGKDAEVYLDGPNTMIDVGGILEIGNDATFTFKQNVVQHGFVRFNNSSLFPSRNIIAGTNSSISLVGTNQARKILAIDQETLYGPSSLVNFVINNGRVEFNAGSRLQFDGLQTNISLNNSRFTSNVFGTYNGHRGVYIYGQPNVTIDNCIFEYGRYGIYGWLSYGGASLTITNSVFRHNDWAIRSVDKGLNTFNCHFQNNNVAVNAANMSFSSYFFEGTVGGSVSTKNNYGIYWNSYSSGSLTLDDPYINTNLYSGVRIYRSPLYVKCGSISYNDIGIFLGNNSSLNMDDQRTPFNAAGTAGVTAINNNYTIRGVWMGYLNLNKGMNDLSPTGFNQQSTVSGTILPRNSFPIQANENQWNSSGTFSSSDYLLTSLNSLNVDIDDSSPLSSITACGQAIPPCDPCEYENPLENCPPCDEINTDDFIEVPLNEATAIAIDLFYANTPDNYREAVNLFCQILMEEYINPGSEEVYLFDLNYRKMMEAIGFAFSSGQIEPNENESGLCQEVDQVITVLDKMITSSVFSEFYERRFAFAMDKVQTYRLAGRRDLALDELGTISGWVESEEDGIELEGFECLIKLERDVLDATVSLETNDIAEMMGACEYTPSNSRIRNSTPSSKKGDVFEPVKVEVSVSPNPTSDFLDVSTNVEKGRISLTNIVGEVLLRVSLNYSTLIDVASYSKGLYFLTVVDELTLEKHIQKVIFK